MATTEIRFSSFQEKSSGRPWVGMVRNRRNTTTIASTQLTPWHRKVAQATPATPIWNTVTNRMSTAMLEREDAARKQKGVLESPRAEKIPVATL